MDMIRWLSSPLARAGRLAWVALVTLSGLPAPVARADHTRDPPRQTNPLAPSVSGILDHSPFVYIGHVNPGGPYPDGANVWRDVYGYAYDGSITEYAGRCFAYVGVGGDDPGMAVFDVTDPGNPLHLDTYGTTEFGDVEVHDGIGYFSSRDSTHIVDLRIDPVAPPLLKSVDGSHEFNVDNAATGRYLYLDDFASHVRVYDVTTPRAPASVVLKTTIVTKGGHSVFARDGRAYVANLYSEEIAIYDVTDIQNGVVSLLTEFETGGGATHGSWPTAGGEYLYVAHEGLGMDLRVFDLSGNRIDLDEVVEIESGRVFNMDLGAGFVGNVHNLFIMGELLFTSWTEAGMALFDIANPRAPVLIGTFDTEATNSGANFNGAFGVYPGLGLDRVLISDRTTGLWIVDVTSIAAMPGVSSLRAVPNPSSSGMAIWFELQRSSDVVVTIFDALGRRVRRVHRTRTMAGRQAVFWNGLDDDGRRVASGVYFCRVEAGGFSRTQRVVLLR
jgi:hypothetical protein